ISNNMLQFNKQNHSLADRNATVSDASPADLLNSIVSFVRRWLWVLLFTTLLTTTIGTIYVFITPPSFTARATIIIYTRKMQLFTQQSLIGDVPVDPGTVDSQVEVVRSENVILAVIKDLRLAEDPEFVGPSGGLAATLFHFAPATANGRGPDSGFERPRRALREFERRAKAERVR